MTPERMSEILQLIYEPAQPEKWAAYHAALAELARVVIESEQTV